MPNRPSQRFVAHTPIGKKLLFRCFELPDGTTCFQFQPNTAVTDANYKPIPGHLITEQKWSIHPSDHLSDYATIVFTQNAGPSSQRSKILARELREDKPIILVSKRFPGFRGTSQKTISKDSLIFANFDPRLQFLTAHFAVRRHGSRQCLPNSEGFAQSIIQFSRFDIICYSRLHALPALQSSNMHFVYKMHEAQWNYDDNGEQLGFLAKSGSILDIQSLDSQLILDFCSELSHHSLNPRYTYELATKYLKLTGPCTDILEHSHSEVSKKVLFELMNNFKGRA